jgi:hypothetical protein
MVWKLTFFLPDTICLAGGEMRTLTLRSVFKGQADFGFVPVRPVRSDLISDKQQLFSYGISFQICVHWDQDHLPGREPTMRFGL